MQKRGAREGNSGQPRSGLRAVEGAHGGHVAPDTSRVHSLMEDVVHYLCPSPFARPQTLLPQLRDSWVEAHGPEKAGHTCKAAGNSFQPRRQTPARIDYVMTSLSVAGCELALKNTPDGHSFSDHFAVLARIRLPGPPAAEAAAVTAAPGTPSPSPPASQDARNLAGASPWLAAAPALFCCPAAGCRGVSEGAPRGGEQQQRRAALLGAAHGVVGAGIQRMAEASMAHLMCAVMLLLQVARYHITVAAAPFFSALGALAAARMQVLTLNTWDLWLVSKKRYNRILHLAEYLANDTDVKHQHVSRALEEIQPAREEIGDRGLFSPTQPDPGPFGPLQASPWPSPAGTTWLPKPLRFLPLRLPSPMPRLLPLPPRRPVPAPLLMPPPPLLTADAASAAAGAGCAAAGVGWARVSSPSGPLDVFNTHLHANYSHKYEGEGGSGGIPAPATDDAACFRMAQMLELCRFVRHTSKSGSRGTVLGGDLNCAPHTLEAAVLQVVCVSRFGCASAPAPPPPPPAARA
ncbi:hypothetical protein TSOC_010615 [Tetrabaena socialis]|uniref:Endonuclease/exonuclease/phosphatase domain-containing protein n=1 Tax=Tetrabaena socialis TaxID=47790 RepID=A0A2J7ZST4_9CHLO|nr:hypothetical protein TSOC_010615 [Tetrabaena socialis]|eukprot:PNH03334.1 hypothetical protein TSOC_010615 [Tetrabaena socialis]